MESLFIEADNNVFQTSSSIIIGVVYRMPDSSIDILMTAWQIPWIR